MTRSLFDSWTRTTATGLIGFYQKHLSPYKGFSCAYRILHQGESCSQYAKGLITNYGMARALPLIRQRFQACSIANQRIQHRQQQRYALANHLADSMPIAHTPPPFLAIELEPDDRLPEEKNPDRMGRRSLNSPACSTMDCNLADVSCDFVDGLSDCAALDCSALDCGSADCSGCDVGSCGS